jgi:hypothetical protein
MYADLFELRMQQVQQKFNLFKILAYLFVSAVSWKFSRLFAIKCDYSVLIS